MSDRDRDASGRPRNARPRDSSGRPLAPGAERPGGPGGEAGTPSDPDDALALADELLAAGRPFAAHEVLEEVWHTAPEVERDLWRGLTQLAVALTHAQRANAPGTVALLRRSAERLAAYAGTTPHGVGVDRLRRTALELAVAAEQSGPGAAATVRVALRG